MSIRAKNFGNTSGTENHIRLRYGKEEKPKPDYSKVIPIPPDCITCNKNRTKSIPNDLRCRACCGTPTTVLRQKKNNPPRISENDYILLNNETI